MRWWVNWLGTLHKGFVHFDAPMSPLELEIYHQMRNVIGIDPAFYEYIFTVDADTVGPYIASTFPMLNPTDSAQHLIH